MKQKIMSIKEISDRTVQLALPITQETEMSTLNGLKIIRTRGALDNKRQASVRVVVKGEMLSVSLLVPGNGAMSTSFSLFADEATKERVDRYLNHYLSLHKAAKKEWEGSVEV